MDIEAWKTLNRLVEVALDLSPSERTTWVEALGPEYEAFKPRLRAVLERLESPSAADFMASMPAWDDASDDVADDQGDAPAAGTIVGRFRLVREIASGGQGSVWLAERIDGMVERPVALKMPVGLSFRPGLAARMAREREILARLAHPHVARLYDAGVTDEGLPYLALEFVDGTPIDSHVTGRRLSVDATLRLFLQVAEAVAYAHGQLVIHRDLKPSNILVTPDGQARLLDFGIAKLIDGEPERDSTMTVAGGRALTLAYASPEQIAGETLGVATDVYSLGVVLYELLCERRPHAPARNSSGALEDAILHDEPPRPSTVAADVARRGLLRGDLDTILLKALKTRPADRYATVDAFADDVRRFLDGRPVSAQPDSGSYRLRKFVTRHRLGVGAAAVVALAIIGGAGAAIWQARAARIERDRADAVKQFITSIFRDIDPNLYGSGRPLSAVDVLVEARQRLDGSPALDSDPAVRAELLRVLGASFLGVGDARNAAAVLTRAVAETAAATGGASADAVSSEVQLARALSLTGKPDEANARLDDVAKRLERTNRLESDTFVDVALLRLEIIITSGGFNKPEAETAARAALDAATRILPAVHPSRAAALQRMSAIMRWQSKDAEAADYAERAYRMYRDVHHGDAKHVAVIFSQNELGRALFQAGRAKEAIDNLKQAAANGAESLRDHVVLRQHLLGTLANTQLAYGEIKDAVANLETAVSFDLKGVSLSPAYLAGQDFVHGRALLAARRLAASLGPFSTAIEAYRRIGDKATTATVVSERAEALVRLGRLAEAQADITPLIAGRGAKIMPAVRRGLWLQGEVYRLRHDTARALPLLREATSFEAVTSRMRIDRATYLVSLGLALLDAGQLDQASRVLEESRAAFARNQGVMTPQHADALAALARVHLAAGRRNDAIGLLEQADAFWRSFDPQLAEASAVARLLRTARPAGTPASRPSSTT